MPWCGMMSLPERKQLHRRSLLRRNEWHSQCAHSLLLKYSSPAPRSSATTRRAPASRKATTARTSASAAARPARDKNIQHKVQEQPAKPGRNDEHEDKSDQCRDENPICRIGALLTVKPKRWSLLPIRGISGQYSDDVIDAARNAPAEIAGFEAWRNSVGYDYFRQCVCERALKPITDLDADPPLVRRNDQQHAIIFGLLATLPTSE